MLPLWQPLRSRDLSRPASRLLHLGRAAWPVHQVRKTGRSAVASPLHCLEQCLCVHRAAGLSMHQSCDCCDCCRGASGSRSYQAGTRPPRRRRSCSRHCCCRCQAGRHTTPPGGAALLQAQLALAVAAAVSQAEAAPVAALAAASRRPLSWSSGAASSCLCFQSLQPCWNRWLSSTAPLVWR